MNKPLFYTICTFSIGAFIIVWLFILAGIPNEKNNDITNTPVTPSREEALPNDFSPAATPTISHYLLISENDKIGIYTVYSNGEKKLNEFLDVNINTLRESDKKAFTEGIIIRDKKDLSYIIEDYVS